MFKAHSKVSIGAYALLSGKIFYGIFFFLCGVEEFLFCQSLLALYCLYKYPALEHQQNTTCAVPPSSLLSRSLVSVTYCCHSVTEPMGTLKDLLVWTKTPDKIVIKQNKINQVPLFLSRNYDFALKPGP